MPTATTANALFHTVAIVSPEGVSREVSMCATSQTELMRLVLPLYPFYKPAAVQPGPTVQPELVPRAVIMPNLV